MKAWRRAGMLTVTAELGCGRVENDSSSKGSSNDPQASVAARAEYVASDHHRSRADNARTA